MRKRARETTDDALLFSEPAFSSVEFEAVIELNATLRDLADTKSACRPPPASVLQMPSEDFTRDSQLFLRGVFIALLGLEQVFSHFDEFAEPEQDDDANLSPDVVVRLSRRAQRRLEPSMTPNATRTIPSSLALSSARTRRFIAFTSFAITSREGSSSLPPSSVSSHAARSNMPLAARA